MPNDDNCDRSFEIFGDVLNELSAMINLYDGYDIIIRGILMWISIDNLVMLIF